MKSNDLSDRFYKFALEIIKIVDKLPKTTAGFRLGKQLFDAGTSISANYEEAKGGYSKSDFTYKISTSFKEARESHLWLRMARDSKMIKEDMSAIIKKAEEIRNILGESVKTAKSRK